MGRKVNGRYTVTGPGLDPAMPGYEDAGQAISRSLTAALSGPEGQDGTWYVRDSILDKTLGYSERIVCASGKDRIETVKYTEPR